MHNAECTGILLTWRIPAGSHSISISFATVSSGSLSQECVTPHCRPSGVQKNKGCSKMQITHPTFPWLFVSLWRDISSLPFCGAAAGELWGNLAAWHAVDEDGEHRLLQPSWSAPSNVELPPEENIWWRTDSVVTELFIFFPAWDSVVSAKERGLGATPLSEHVLDLFMLLQSVMSASDFSPPCLWRNGLICVICHFQVLCASWSHFLLRDKNPLKAGF